VGGKLAGIERKWGMAEEAATAKDNITVQEMLEKLKERKGLLRNGFPGNPEILERVRRLERTDALISEEVHKAAAKGDDLERLSLLDPITELYNHRTIVKELQAELKRAERYEHTTALCLLAIDGFDSLVEHYGLLTGDAVLRVVGNVIRTGVREVDIIGRYTGSNFLFVLPRASAAGAALVAERIRQRVGNQAIIFNWQNFSVTASAGVSAYPEHGAVYDELIARAMEAMSYAIARGGDRVLSV
jgi:diguanylate cyclase (GGDEF)-like protein